MNSVYAKWQTQVVQVRANGRGGDSCLCICLECIMSKIYLTQVGKIYTLLEPKHILQAEFWCYIFVSYIFLSYNTLVCDVQYNYKNFTKQNVPRLWNTIK